METTPEPTDDMQFDKAEYLDKSTAPNTCEVCKTNLSNEYFKINQSIVCPSCKAKIVENFSSQNLGSRILKSFLFGIPAAVLGAVIYYAIVALTKYEIGLVAIVIGWMVGTAVQKGSGNRGGLPFQVIAVLLTYTAISSFYFPDILASIQADSGAQSVGFSQLVVIFVISLGIPFLLGFKNILGLVIIGFAMFEAWRLNQKTIVDVHGPFTLRANPN